MTESVLPAELIDISEQKKTIRRDAVARRDALPAAERAAAAETIARRMSASLRMTDLRSEMESDISLRASSCLHG